MHIAVLKGMTQTTQKEVEDMSIDSFYHICHHELTMSTAVVGTDGQRKRPRWQKLLGDFFDGKEKRRIIQDPVSSLVAIM